MANNDITGDRLTSKIDRNNLDSWESNYDKIFGKKKETNGGYKVEPNNEGSVINLENKVDS
jgi:hypothetical protein